jgi:site-specific recombinase XerD
VIQLTDFLLAQGMPTNVANINREHLESFIVSLRDRGAKPSTMNNRYRALQQFWRFLLEEGEIKSTPFARMKAPKIPEEPVDHVELADLKALLKTCAARTVDGVKVKPSFEDLRDEAMIRLFVDTGVRSAELIGITLDDIDPRGYRATVLGKGRRPRDVAFAAKTSLALQRYEKARALHTYATSSAYWLGPRGPMTDSGIRQMLERRSKVAGIRHVHPHALRHSAAVEHMRAGGSETGLQRHMGWRSPQMIRRYTQSAADELAREEHRRMALGDRL